MADTGQKKVTVVVPVYGDWPSLAECIASVKEHVDSRHSVLFVNDCGPDVEQIEKNLKRAIKGTDFQYFRNKKNLGFVGTCNRAVLELDKTKNDILLLNSDTKVTAGFLEEMLEVLYASPKHGAVSPRSNNATIATVPFSAIHQKGIDKDESFRLYKRLKTKLPRFTVVPTAHGFCMLVRRSLIRQYGLFDSVFGRGYGEEVDFCQRIARHGHLSLLSNRAYVFHLEARSFSPETKAKLLDKNEKIIWQRYPDYRQAVRDYVARAMLQEGRALGERQSFSPKQAAKKLLRRSPRLYNLAQKLTKR